MSQSSTVGFTSSEDGTGSALRPLHRKIGIEEVARFGPRELRLEALLAQQRERNVRAVGRGVRRETLARPPRLLQLFERQRALRRGAFLLEEPQEDPARRPVL